MIAARQRCYGRGHQQWNSCTQFWKLPDGSDEPIGRAAGRGGRDLRLVDVGVDLGDLLAAVGECPMPV